MANVEKMNREVSIPVGKYISNRLIRKKELLFKGKWEGTI